MNRASIILKNAREDKDLEIAEVSKKLKISKNYLEAIEGEFSSDYPSEPYCSLIIKDYATFLGLNGSDILSLFRRDFASPSKLANQNLNQMSFTPQTIFKWSVVISMLLFLSYIVVEYLKYNRPPMLQVNWPEDKALALNSNLEISGQTDSEATVRINNDLIIIDSVGNFHKSLILRDASQKISIVATSHSGKTTSVEKTYHPQWL